MDCQARARQVRILHHGETLYLFGVEWSPDGELLASGSYQREVHVWDVSTGAQLWVGHGQPTTIRRVAWSPGGKQLASCGYDGSVVMWEAATGIQQACLQ